MIVGETNGHKIIVFLVATVIWILKFLFITHQCSGCAAVMSVGNVHSRYLSKNCGDLLIDGGIFNYPELMSEPIQFGCEIIFRFVFNNSGYNIIEIIAMRISKKHRFQVGIIHPNVFHAVFFLVAAGKLVFFNVTGHVILHTGTNNQPVLCTAIHGLGIHIILFGFILNEPAIFTEHGKVFGSFQIHFLVVLVCAGRKINFRLDNVIKRIWISGCFLSCFFRTKYVVRT